VRTLRPEPLALPTATPRVTARPPFATPFFYGWVVVGVSMSVSFLAGTTGQIFMAIMLKPMSEELGWSRSETAGAVFFGTVCGGAMAPLTGWLADRFGGRALMPLGALAVGLALIWQGGTADLLQFYLAYAIARTVASNFASGVVPLTLAANWFRRRRGRAMGFISMAFPLGGSAMTLLGQMVMEHSGWRTVFVLAGVVLIIGGVLPALFLLRRQPEDVGLTPDGEAPVHAPAATATAATLPVAHSAPAHEESFTLSEAVRTSTFWLLVATISITNLPNASLSYQMVAYYSDQGVPTAIAAGALSAFAFAGAVSSVVWGYLSERISERILAVSVMLFAIGSTVLMWTVHDPIFVIPLGGLLGLAARGEGALLNMIVAHYFGRGHYGKITGLIQPFSFIGLGGGPLLASVLFDLTHGYQWVFISALACYGAGIVCILLTRAPQRPRRPASLSAG